LATWCAFLGDRFLDDITPDDVVRVIEHLRAARSFAQNVARTPQSE
jgi:hypothetical protein